MNKSIGTIIVVLIIFFIVPQIYAAPAINFIEGTFEHNNSVTINGTNFGIKPKAAPVLWDTVDNIESYSQLSNGATIPVGGSNPWPSPYGNSSGRDHVKYNTSDQQRGTSKAQYKATNVMDGYLDGLTWAKTDHAYVSWWWKTDTNIGGTTHSSKLLRMSDISDETGKTHSWTQMHSIIYNGSDGGTCTTNWHSFSGNPNNWNFLEAWFDNINQTYTLRVNGVEKVHESSWTGCGPFNFNEVWKIGFDSGGVSPIAITWWMDDIYVDNTLARVMLGNASDFTNCTQFEMQFPTEWTNNSISLKINTGAFREGQTAYVFVINSDGIVSSGKAVTIGQSVTESEPAPPLPAPQYIWVSE